MDRDEAHETRPHGCTQCEGNITLEDLGEDLNREPRLRLERWPESVSSRLDRPVGTPRRSPHRKSSR
jgi:hypothetical protein